MTKKFVVNATDSNTLYSFFMPIVSILWKNIGFKTLNVITNQGWDNEHQKYVLSKIVHQSDILHRIDPVPNLRVSTSVQTVRVLAACAPELEPNDYLITSDVDMLPLDNNYFNNYNEDLFNVYSADAYGDHFQVPKYPICYLGAKVHLWQEVMHLGSKDLQVELNRAMDGRLDSWDNDEMFLGGKLRTSQLYPSRCNFMLRGWPFSRADRRLDRDHWYLSGEKYIDCHCKRPGNVEKDIILNVIKKSFNGEVVNAISEYFDGYNKI